MRQEYTVKERIGNHHPSSSDVSVCCVIGMKQLVFGKWQLLNQVTIFCLSNNGLS